MQYILNPLPVAPYFTLNECLRWVAYKQYAASWHYLSNADDRKSDIVEGMFEANRIEYPFYEREDYEREILLELEEEPALSFDSLNDIPSFTQEDTLRIHNEFRIKYAEYCKEKEDIINNFEAPAKSELFLKLKKGDLLSYGQLRGKIIEGYSLNLWKTDEAWEEYNYESISMSQLDEIVEGENIEGFQKIPAKFWLFDGIEWKGNYARSRQGWFDYIFVESKNLFKLFPQPAPKFCTIEERAGFLITDDKSLDLEFTLPIKSNRGRPPYNWAEFHAELTRYIIESGGVLPKQTSLEQTMQTWCKNKWGLEPSHGAIHSQISPHYKSRIQVRVA